MCQREVLVIGDGTTISTWSYEQGEGLGGCTAKQTIFLGQLHFFKKKIQFGNEAYDFTHNKAALQQSSYVCLWLKGGHPRMIW